VIAAPVEIAATELVFAATTRAESIFTSNTGKIRVVVTTTVCVTAPAARTATAVGGTARAAVAWLPRFKAAHATRAVSVIVAKTESAVEDLARAATTTHKLSLRSWTIHRSYRQLYSTRKTVATYIHCREM